MSKYLTTEEVRKYFVDVRNFRYERNGDMTEKEWLQRAWNIEKEIQELEERRMTVRNEILRITPSYEYRGNQTFHSGNCKEAKYIKLIEFSQRIDKHIEELYKVKTEIDKAIDKVPNSKLRRLLKLRYIDFKTWEDIADEMNYALRHIMRLHGKALIAIRCIICK